MENMTGKINIRVRDYSDEYGSMAINTDDVTTAQLWQVPDDWGDALATHIDALSLGTVVSVAYAQPTQAANDARPASAFAQRELGFRFMLRDQVNQKLGYFTVPCADLGIGAVVAGQDELDLSAAPVAAFVSWLETNAKSGDGNAIVVERAIIVGRNS